MNVIELAKQAYAPTSNAMRTPQSVEAQLFSDITRQLADKTAPYPKLVEAVHRNRQLWIALAVDVADQGNRLPKELRAQIIYLAEFTNIHSAKFLRGEADLTALIDINSAISRGLRAQGAKS